MSAVDPDSSARQAAQHLAAGRAEDALRACEVALAVQPDHPEALAISALVLFRKGDAEEAVDRLVRAIAQRPDSADMLANLGQIQLERRQFEAAEGCFAAALDLSPDDLFTRLRLALTLVRRGRMTEAETVYRDLIKRAPDYALAHHDFATALQAQGRVDEAIKHYDEASRLAPEDLAARATAARQRLMLARWQGVENLRQEIVEPALRPGGSPQPPSPLDTLALPCPIAPRDFRTIVANFARATGLIGTPRFSFTGVPRPAGRRLRIGYLSSDFGNHPVGHVVSGLFGRHDRGKFEVIAYAATPDDGSPERQRIAANVERLIDLSTADAGTAARRIHDDGIDILVDLNGHTQNNRLDVLALRPAPVQATWFGFAGTLGVNFIDYLIADPVVVPEADAPYYNEQLVYLPDAYIAVDAGQVAAPTRSSLGLPERGFVFGMFSATYKIEPLAFGIWMRVLQAVPDSILWLWTNNEEALANLRREAAARGVSPERLMPARTVPRRDHLVRQAAADLLLDTLFYGAHTTAADALAAGVAVVTCTGSRYAARASTALLCAAGLSELAARTPEDYEAIVRRLATEPGALADVRRRLKAAHAAAPLFDTARFVRGLETAFRSMWERYLSGAPPQMIRVPRSESPQQ